MKTLNNYTLTGHEQLDAYLIGTSSPLDMITVYDPDFPFPETSHPLHAYADSQLSKEEFQELMENYYPGGFEQQFHYYVSSLDISVYDFYGFLETLLKNEVWLEDVIPFLRKSSQYTEVGQEVAQELYDYAVKNNLSY